MAYPLLLLIDLIGIFLIDVLLLANVKIQQDLPATMMPGSEIRVTVDVDKGDLSGFAKLQLDLPAGLTCTAIETKGASFTFADQKAKFIWMSLPSSPSFRVSYNLKAEPEAKGTLPITGRLSYIEDNERKTYELPSSTVTIMGDPNVLVNGAPDNVPEGDQDVVTAAGGAPVSGIASMNEPASTGAVTAFPAEVDQNGVTGKRVITPITESELLVEITLQKGTIRGFGKIQETIPEGFTALEKTSAQAIFTGQGRIVKLVWLNLPADPEIKVSYKLRANDQPFAEYSVSGEFGYLKNDETMRTNLGTTSFITGPKALEALAADDADLNAMNAKDGSELAKDVSDKGTESGSKDLETLTADGSNIDGEDADDDPGLAKDRSDNDTEAATPKT
ncbi:MAG: hypothetical protein KDB88_03850, partial [Flavobacteriales bacterium]|nr:hypothetical protein [Flavobacteriales bacterium]